VNTTTSAREEELILGTGKNASRYALKRWGEEGGLPVLALHGWLDNAASFDVLAPLLPNCDLVALDMAGHGKSDYRSGRGAYTLWEDVIDIPGIADKLGWQRFVLLGHSRGAMVATLYASATGTERVQALVALDALLPVPVAVENTAGQLRKSIRDSERGVQQGNKVYADREKAMAARSRAAGILEESAALLASRGLKSEGDGYRWNHDPRLLYSTPLKLSAEQNDALLKANTVPSLALMAEDGFMKKLGFIEALQGYPSLEVKTLPGGHHFHMEGGADRVAEEIQSFLEINTDWNRN
jgi:pimeloyl-ACP methyl ester carboxylesterase